MGKVWFTSDTHFGSKRTLELSKRPFDSVEEMDNYIINKWNKIVQSDDIVYHLGDFGDYSVVKKLNGKVILLLGNYERKDNIGVSTLINFGFYDVFTDKSVFIADSKAGYMLDIAHEPSNLDKTIFGLFGHIHKLQMVRKYGLNVGVDCHNFKPIDVNTINFYKNAIEKFYDKEVFD